LDRLRKYSIHFSGLKQGKQNFEFKIDKGFFEDFGNTEILDAEIDIDVEFEKHSNNLSLNFSITGIIVSSCDRCLEPIDVEIDYSPVLYVNFGDETSDITDVDDTMILSRTEDTLDLAKHFYDYVCLNIPIQKYHPDDENGESTCNPEMIEKLKNYSIHHEMDKEIDPRWDKLKNLYN
jgi:uncharacterized metal-binding protein YceD (DUF177 family)